MKEISKLKY